MTLADYDAVMIGWDEVHRSEDDEIQAPDAETVRREFARLRGE